MSVPDPLTALYSKRAHRGILFKAKRGTLTSRWAQRFFWLRGNNLSYYREPLQIQNLINARASAQSVLGAILPHDPRRATMVRVRVLDAARVPCRVLHCTFTGADGVLRRGGVCTHVVTQLAKLKRIEEDLNTRLKAVLQHTFVLVPGETRLTVPRGAGAKAGFRTPYAFRLINPDGDSLCMCAATSAERRMWIT